MHSDFSRYDVYTEVGSLYCYKDSHVLKNNYGVRDYQTLRMPEQDVVGAKQQYLLIASHIRQIYRSTPLVYASFSV